MVWLRRLMDVLSLLAAVGLTAMIVCAVALNPRILVSTVLGLLVVWLSVRLTEGRTWR